MTRFRAFGIHLAISVAIFVLVLGLLVLVWYPWPLFGLEGGWQGIRLVALVDIVIGPVLTLILFKVGNPGLKLDMGLVVMLQVGALAYGMWNLYDARPVLLVHADDHFRPVSRALLTEWDANGRVLAQWEGITPQTVRVELPDDPGAFADLYLDARRRPGGLHGLAERYQPLHAAWQKALHDAVRIEPYVGRVASWQERLDDFLRAEQRGLEELAFFPYTGRRERVFLVFDRGSREIVGVLDIPYDPALASPEVPRIERIRRAQSTQAAAPSPANPVDGVNTEAASGTG